MKENIKIEGTIFEIRIIGSNNCYAMALTINLCDAKTQGKKVEVKYNISFKNKKDYLEHKNNFEVGDAVIVSGYINEELFFEVESLSEIKE